MNWEKVKAARIFEHIYAPSPSSFHGNNFRVRPSRKVLRHIS